jgi:subtilisin family serine protease
LVVAAGVAHAEPHWLYVRLQPGTLPLVQSRTLWLGNDAHVVRTLLAPEQTLAWQRLHGSQQVLLSSERRMEIEQAEEPLVRTVVVLYTGTLPPSKFCQYLMAQHPLVEYAEPVRRQRLLLVPNDPLFPDQQYLQTIEAPAAWDRTTGSPSVLIGISDSGVRTTHEDLTAAIALNTGEIPGNGIDDDGNGYIDDYRGYNLSWRDDRTAPDDVYHPTDAHGTNVAGIIAATQNNGKGISGIAPGCRIVPIKATPNSTDGFILFGYESLIYAAVRGCKVVNCSWGNDDQAPSPIEESIVAYAIARDVAIVAASGNGTETNPMYPAAYPGVLGVGETDASGRIVPGTGIGAHCRLLAPGENARTTDSRSNSSYTYFSGTSSAAPMASGVVALVRSRYPQLSALQAIEHVRLSALDVSAINPDVAAIIPGLVNARSALERDPFSTPAIVPLRYELTRLDGTPVERTRVGDTVLVTFYAVNRLGSGTNLQWDLEVLQAWGGQTDAVDVLDARIYRRSVEAGEQIAIGPFSIAIVREAPTRHFFRLRVQGTGSGGAQYRDVALLPFFPTPDWSTIHGDSLLLSVGDYGWFGRNTGSGQEPKGEGFGSPRVGSVLYGGGVFAVDFSNERVRSGIEGDGLNFENELVPSSIERGEREAIRVLRDVTTSTGQAIGIELREHITIVDDSTVAIRTDVLNTSDAPISDVAVGYYFDFDLTPGGDSSAVTLVLDGTASCAELIERMPADPMIVALVRSGAGDAVCQCAGLDGAYATARNFIPERKMESLRRGTTLQMGGLGDKSIVVGARFPDTIAPNQQRTFEVAVLLGRDRRRLLERTRSLASIEQTSSHGLWVAPNPVWSDELLARCAAAVGRPSSWQLVGIDGRLWWEVSHGATPEQVRIPLASIPSGAYMLSVRSDQQRWMQLVLRVR